MINCRSIHLQCCWFIELSCSSHLPLMSVHKLNVLQSISYSDKTLQWFVNLMHILLTVHVTKNACSPATDRCIWPLLLVDWFKQPQVFWWALVCMWMLLQCCNMLALPRVPVWSTDFKMILMINDLMINDLMIKILLVSQVHLRTRAEIWHNDIANHFCIL